MEEPISPSGGPISVAVGNIPALGLGKMGACKNEGAYAVSGAKIHENLSDGQPWEVFKPINTTARVPSHCTL